MRRNRVWVGATWLASLSCLCILGGAATAWADGAARTVPVTLQPLEKAAPADVTLMYLDGSGEEVRAASLGKDTWEIQVAKTQQKLTLWAEGPSIGRAMADVTLPAGSNVSLKAYIQGDVLHVDVLPVSVSVADLSAPNPTGFATRASSEARQGGDTCATATVIPSLPFGDSGTTVGYANNYDGYDGGGCPYSGSTSPDVVYQYTPGANQTVDITLCNGSAYDTKVYVFGGTCGNMIECDDDACGSPSYQSEILGLSLTGGTTYYIVVDGYGGASGSYQLDITAAEPPANCPTLQCGDQCPRDDCDLQVGINGSFVQACEDGQWTSLAFPFDTGGAFVTSIRMTHNTNTGVGDLYLMADAGGACTGPDVNNILWVGCGVISGQPAGVMVDYPTGGVATPATGVTWVVAVPQTGFAFDVAYDDETVGTPNAAFGNLDGGGTPSLWQDLNIYAFGAAYCVELAAGAPPAGACCDDTTGLCTDDVAQNECTGRFEADTLCADLDPPCGNPGACCNDDTAICVDGVLQVDCLGRFAPGTLCADLDPVCGAGAPLGACCNPADHSCTPGKTESDCDMAFGPGNWHEGVGCDPNPCITGCDHSIVLYDTYGDGWNGGWVEVFVAGDSVGVFTLATGAGPETHYFTADTGDTIQTVYHAGDWSYENGYRIYDVNGTLLCSDGGGTTPVGCTVTGYCGPDPCAGNEPPNDDCVTATPVSGPYPVTVTGDNTCAEIDCPGVLDWNSTWFAVDLPYAVNNLYVDYCGTAQEIYTVGIVIYHSCGDCPAYDIADSYAFVTCPDYLTNPQMEWREIPGPATVYFPVYAVLEDDSPIPYSVTFDVVEVLLPPNDFCDDAIPVSVPSVTPGWTTGATTDYGFPSPCGTGSITSPGVWYSVIGTGHTMTADLCNGATSYDAKLNVYCPDCAEAMCVGGNDDSCGLQSRVTWCSQAGANYLILVHGYGGATGSFELVVTDNGVPCSATVACLPEGACCLPDASCIIATEGECAAQGGGYNGDDTDCSGDPVMDATITIEILTDNWGSETSWELLDENGQVVAEDDGLSSNTLYTTNVPVYSTGCYTFTIFDSYGDGICCAYGYGYYNVYLNGELVATGGDFGSSETVANIGGCTGEPTGGGIGACCFGDGSCALAIESCCEYVGGSFLGGGTNCGEILVEVVSANFNAGLPGDWTVTNNIPNGAVLWVTNNTANRPNYAGGNGLCMDSDPDRYSSSSKSYDTSLRTPAFVVPGGAKLDYDAAYNYLSTEQAQVNITINGGATWINLLTWVQDHSPYGPGEHVTIDLGAYTGNTAQVEFRHVGTGWDWWYEVDNVVISGLVQGDNPCPQPADLDIKPGSCPNSFNRGSHGVLPVALMSTPQVDVNLVDLATVKIARADGIGGFATPNEGPPGPHSVYEDVATPFEGEWCACHEMGGDGIMDLSMKFRTDDVVAALQLDEFPGGALVELVVTGFLTDGTEFFASDCVRLVPPGTPPGIMAVQSNVPGVWVQATPLDDQLDGGGFADFERTYGQGTVVTLMVPASSSSADFTRWIVDGVNQPTGVRSVQLTVTGATHTATAQYRVRTKPGSVGTQDHGVSDMGSD